MMLCKVFLSMIVILFFRFEYVRYGCLEIVLSEGIGLWWVYVSESIGLCCGGGFIWRYVFVLWDLIWFRFGGW